MTSPLPSPLPSPLHRVYVGSLATETNTFSPLRTDMNDFKDSFYAPPGKHPDTPTLCSAIIPLARRRADELGWHVIEGTATWAEPGGMVNQSTWETLRDTLLEEVRSALPLDAVLLGLHGAMIAQNCQDCEGELIAAVRKIVGKKTIIGVTFDPHSHLSQQRVDNTDLLLTFKEFPHTDFVLTAHNLIQLTHQALSDTIKCHTSVFDCKMIGVLPTSQQPMRGFVDRLIELEKSDPILSISLIHGFMAGDVPDLGAKIIVITDNAPSHGNDLAKQLGLELFSLKDKTQPEFLTAEVALEQAVSSNNSPVVVADVWDNPGGGVAGDSTIIVREMMRLGIKNAALATIWDPMAVRLCVSAGEGAHFPLRFGGKTSATSGDPIDSMVTVRKIRLGATQRFGDSIVPMGDCACISIGDIDIVLNTIRSQVFSTDVFEQLGIDPKDKKILVVKSTNHFYDSFAKISNDILYASINGLYPNDPSTNDYKNLKRAIWPRVKNPHGDQLNVKVVG